MKKILVIIPAYNEEASISAAIDDIKSALACADIVVVNDASADRTAEIARNKGAVVLDMPFNIGIGWAVQAGLRYGLEYGYDIAAQFDADGQHRAKDLPKMLAAIEGEGTDMVIASRFLLNQGFRSTFFRRLGIRYFSFLIFILTGARITDPTSGFRMANRSLIELFSEHYAEDYPEPESTVLALKKGFYVREIPTQMQPRQTGISSITPLKALYYMVKVTLGILMANIRNNNK